MNSTLTSLVNDVYTLTNRPDLVGETLLAVRNATLKAHNTDYYYKDLLETGIQFDYAVTQQTADLRLLVPRYRALKYVRMYETSGRAGKVLEIITPDNILDSYSIHKEDICYVAGRELKIRSRAAHQYFLMGCYVHPDVTPDNYQSWIADEQPSAIVYQAAAVVFKTIGYDEQNATYRDMVADEYRLLQQANIVATGY